MVYIYLNSEVFLDISILGIGSTAYSIPKSPYFEMLNIIKIIKYIKMTTDN